MKETGKVYLVGAGPGDTKLITLRGLECIKEADVIAYDHLVNSELLVFARPETEIIYVGKKGYHHRVEQEKINQLLVEKAMQGKIVTRLKGGDPFIFGRGGEEALALAENNIPFEIVPGVSSAYAVPAYAGIPVTHRGLSSAIFVTGREDETKGKSQIDWQKLATASDTLVFLMGVKNLPLIIEKLIEHGRAKETPIALIRSGTTMEQETIVGTLETIISQAEQNKFKPPAIIVVGEAVNLRKKLAWFEKKLEVTPHPNPLPQGERGRGSNMIGILLLGHGSRQKNAEREFNLVSNVISTLIPYPVCQAVLGNGEPTIETAVENLINPDIKKIIVAPVFLFEGTHVQIDIPDKLNNLRLKYPSIEFEMTDCFGADGRIVDIITSRIKQIIGDGFAPDSLPQTPSKIEQESFNRIEKSLNLIGTPDSHPLIVKKIVHTVGDLAIASEVYAPSEAVDAGVKAIRDGKNIVTDVEMVKAGIRGKKLSSFGSDIFCLIKENKIAEDASKQGTTRAALAIKTAAEMAEDGIIAIGNAPTALFEVCRLLKAKTIKPALVIGAPVGFVGCSESKEVLMRSGVPCIVVKGARGGSPVAAAIVNALIDLADM